MAQSDPLPGSHPPKATHPRSLFSSLFTAVLVFIGLVLLSEGLFRATCLDQVFPLRSLGIYHAQFEIKWFELKDYVREHGGVDVLLLGNSMVNTGIDPDILADEYEFRAAESLRVFNFGVEGLTVAPNSVIARILVQKYHPRTLIFVTEMRDYAAGNGVEVEQQLLGDEWMLARQGGQETPRAWLKENSTVVQHLLPFRNWSRADFLDTFLMSVRRYRDTSPSGYEADLNTGTDIDVPPDPDDPDEQGDFALFADFSIDPGRLVNLGSILDLSHEGTTVIITEMPVYPTYFTYFGGEQYHDNYLSELVPFITEKGGVFLPAVSWEHIPLDYRVDHHHLNDKGAALFSALLAEQLAESCRSDGVCLQPASVVQRVP